MGEGECRGEWDGRKKGMKVSEKKRVLQKKRRKENKKGEN